MTTISQTNPTIPTWKLSADDQKSVGSIYTVLPVFPVDLRRAACPGLIAKTIFDRLAAQGAKAT